MARTGNDTGDLAISVGSTATGVAAGRALASRGPAPSLDDPLVRAVGVDFAGGRRRDPPEAANERVEPRRPAGVPAVRRPAPAAGHQHRTGGANGSRLACENIPPNSNQVETTWQARMSAVTDRWRKHGFEIEWAELWYPKIMENEGVQR